jgi:hypothetical protein
MGTENPSNSVTPFSLGAEPAGIDPSGFVPVEGADPGAGGNTNPASGATPDGTSAESKIQVLEGGKFRFGEKEFDADELASVIEAGINPSERDKAATEKFQQASEERKQLEAQMQEFGYLKSMAEGLAQLPNEAQEAIFKFAGEIDAAVKAGQPIPTPGQAQAPATPWKIDPLASDQLPKWEDMSDEAKAVVSVLMPQMQAMQNQIQAMSKTLPEVSAFVKGSQAERQATTAAGAIKSEFGVDVTPQELSDAVKATKISDPHAAWVFQNRTRIQAQAATQAAQAAGEKPATPPAAQGRVFDPQGMSAEQIFANLQAGNVMKS